MGQQITQFWNTRKGEDFDLRAQTSGRILAIERMAALARPHLNTDDKISIDLGCGTGLFAKTVGHRQIIGFDFSEPFLDIARQRMDKTVQKSLFELQLESNSVDNAVSLFVIDDYPSHQKTSFFSQVFTWLKPGGHFFFAAYSPADERMGKKKVQINTKTAAEFEIFLEDSISYENRLADCGFKVSLTELLSATGHYKIETESIAVQREFILLIAQKPSS